MSALRENVEKKGKNSYYYAHERIINGPQWDGNEEPRLIHRIPSINNPNSPSRNESYTLITDYAWSEDDSKVSIYVTVESREDDLKGQLTSEDIKLQWTENSITVDLQRVPGSEQWHRLYLDRLNGTISSCEYRLRKGKVVLILVKQEPAMWIELREK